MNSTSDACTLGHLKETGWKSRSVRDELRGQAKTRLLRMLVHFLDPELPMLAGTDLNDDPCAPVSRTGRRQAEKAGDDAPIAWLPREHRYREKLATPDVTYGDMLKGMFAGFEE